MTQCWNVANFDLSKRTNQLPVEKSLLESRNENQKNLTLCALIWTTTGLTGMTIVVLGTGWTHPF